HRRGVQPAGGRADGDRHRRLHLPAAGRWPRGAPPSAQGSGRAGGLLKPAAFEYRRPESLEEALDLLAEHGDEAKPLAGGQSLVPLLAMRLAQPALLVDLQRVPGLQGVREGRIGAMTTQAALEGEPALPPVVKA